MQEVQKVVVYFLVEKKLKKARNLPPFMRHIRRSGDKQRRGAA